MLTVNVRELICGSVGLLSGSVMVKSYVGVKHITCFFVDFPLCQISCQQHGGQEQEHPVQALRLCTGRTAHRGSRGIALPFHDHCTRRGEGSASRPGRFLSPGKTLYPLYRRLGGPQGRSGQVWKTRSHRYSIPDRPARSQSLYRLRYPAHSCQQSYNKCATG